MTSKTRYRIQGALLVLLGAYGCFTTSGLDMFCAALIVATGVLCFAFDKEAGE